jgi:hypothetical protein
MKRTPVINCPKCHGTGLIDLPETLHATLSFVRKHPGCVAAQISDLERTTACTRLQQLFKLGFVSRVRQGKSWHYSIKKP